MGTLANLKHEAFTRNLLRNNFNASKAYLETYHCSPSSASAAATQLISQPHIRRRTLEILSENKVTNLYSLLNSFEDDLASERPVVVDGSLEMVRDNPTILEAKKTLLKMYGSLPTGGEQKMGDTFIDARSVHISPSDVKEIDALCQRIDALQQQLCQDNEKRDDALEV